MTETQPNNLMDGLFKEMSRVREVITQYEDPELKGAGVFAAALRSIQSNDVIEMLQAYKELKEWES